MKEDDARANISLAKSPSKAGVKLAAAAAGLAGPAAPPAPEPAPPQGASLQPAGRVESAPETIVNDGQQVLFLGPAYLLLLAVAEVLSSVTGPAIPSLGPAIFGAALLLLLVHAFLCRDRPFHLLPLTLAAAPALRLAVLLGPAGTAPALRWLALGLPIVVAAGVALALRGLLPRLRAAAGAAGGALQDLARVSLHSLSRAWHVTVRWASASWQNLTRSLPRRCAFSQHERPVPFGAPALTLPAFTLLLAVAAGTALAYSGSARAWAVAEERRPPSSFQHERSLAEGMGSLATIAVPETRRGTFHSDSKDSRLLPSVVTDPWPVVGKLPRGVATAFIPIADGMHDPTATPIPLTLDDALVPQLAAPAAPAAVSLAVAFPDCPSDGYGNPYPRAVCTWYVKAKRPDLPGFYGDWGLAVNWPTAAERCGFPVDGVPAAGAVIVFPPGANGAYEGGHVGYVEAVEADALLTSECNVDHSSAGIVEPTWWDSGYACAYRRIPWERLSPDVMYIHFRGDPVRLPPLKVLPRDGTDDALGAAGHRP